MPNDLHPGYQLHPRPQAAAEMDGRIRLAQ
ncbi:hypothetical protein [Paenibacillus sp. VMFN-D1]